MPYAPGIQYHGDQYYNRAIAGLGENVAQAIGNYRRTKEESQAADAAFETLVKGAAPLAQSGRLDPKVLEELGDPSKFSGLSLSAKKAKLGQAAVSFKMLLDEADRADRRKADQELATYRNETLGMQRTASDRALQEKRDTMKALMEAAPAVRGAGTNPEAAALENALRNNPGADPEVMQRIISQVGRTEGRQLPKADEIWAPIQVGNHTGRVNRLTGQTEWDPQDQKLEATEIRDPSGNVIRYSIGSGKQQRFVPPARGISPGEELKGLNTIADLSRDRMMVAGDQAELQRIDADIARVEAILRGRKTPSSNNGGDSGPAQKPTTPPAKKGARVSQGGVIYEYDGSGWKAVR